MEVMPTRRYNVNDMDKAVSTNPAQRAYNFLQDYTNVSKEIERNSANPKVRNVLAKMYGRKVSETSFLMIVLSDLWKLPVQIREGITKIGLDPSFFEHVMADLEKVLTMMMLDSQTSTVRINIPQTLASSLGMISNTLNKDLPEPMLSAQKIEELLGTLSGLSADIRSADLDNEFKDFILHKIDSISYALGHYETLGPNEVVERVDQLFGSFLRKMDTLTNTKKKSGFMGTLLNVGLSIILAINATNSVFELSENLSNFITSQAQAEGVIVPDIKDPRTITEASSDTTS